jgi:hypothetical protein
VAQPVTISPVLALAANVFSNPSIPVKIPAPNPELLIVYMPTADGTTFTETGNAVDWLL